MSDPWLRTLDGDWLEAVERIEHHGQPHPWSRVQLMGALTDPQGSVWGVGVGEQASEGLCGFAVLSRQPFDAELQAITVAPQVRRQGLAGRLVTALIDQAVGWGSERLLLEVRASNQAALALYRRSGFRDDGVRRGYYPPLNGCGAREDALLMSFPLVGSRG
ncbi:[SSU ribosomal protein S18P]-alanine acetyltransferase [Franzmannia pantelleriensis]|uniref:[SSU ribosomal protein S18P]-alanine acetyltransferase n=1 Tax=Franzmannia pantelleriensis TaxID=48727 RepID=A0A1G9QK92_9GAMM|nr:ribosomal protein S18-alanine N-acetyltransferase [Halomonas pantelleriensis]SDM11406.1 [SSU ribosomal protein S18P]-alanine acetyltransferase [Halomonas pantelleriensis]